MPRTAIATTSLTNYRRLVCWMISTIGFGLTVLAQEQDKAAAQDSLGNQARLTIRLPADAELFLNDVHMPAKGANRGEKRTYVTPPLESDRKYVYTVKVDVVRAGKTVSTSRDVTVKAGQTTEVDLSSEPGHDVPVVRIPSLASHIRTDVIELPQGVKHDARGLKPSLILCALQSGEYVLGWNDRTGALHASRLTADFRLRGEDVTVPGLDLRGLVAHEDGSLAVLAAELPNRMCVLRFGSDGKQLFKTVLIGEKGREEGQHFLNDHFCVTARFGTSGTDYAVHFAHSANFGQGGVHQGGYYAQLDFKGGVHRADTWTISHSLDQRLLFHNDCFFTLSAGDCFPKGLWVQNRKSNVGQLIYPAADQRENFGNCAGSVNATLGSMVSIGSQIAIAFLTKDDRSQDAVYILLDEDCSVRKTVKLTQTPTINEQVVKLAPFGKNLLLVWQETDKATKLRVINAQGDFLNDPVSIEHPVPQSDDLVVFPNGDVGWLNARDGDRKLTLVRIVVQPSPGE